MKRALLATAVSAVLSLAGASAASASRLKVTWMPGFHAPGSAVRYDRVGVIKVGSPSAKNVPRVVEHLR